MESLDALLDHAQIVGAKTRWKADANGRWVVELDDPLSGRRTAVARSREEAAAAILRALKLPEEGLA